MNHHLSAAEEIHKIDFTSTPISHHVVPWGGRFQTSQTEVLLTVGAEVCHNLRGSPVRISDLALMMLYSALEVVRFTDVLRAALCTRDQVNNIFSGTSKRLPNVPNATCGRADYLVADVDSIIGT